jgi:hypothetical protein
MKKTLYLLRKPFDQINPSIFLPTESQGDVVLLGDAGGQTFSYAGGTIIQLRDGQAGNGITYDDLVQKIFAADHTVII